MSSVLHYHSNDYENNDNNITTTMNKICLALFQEFLSYSDVIRKEVCISVHFKIIMVS